MVHAGKFLDTADTEFEKDGKALIRHGKMTEFSATVVGMLKQKGKGLAGQVEKGCDRSAISLR